MSRFLGQVMEYTLQNSLQVHQPVHMAVAVPSTWRANLQPSIEHAIRHDNAFGLRGNLASLHFLGGQQAGAMGHAQNSGNLDIYSYHVSSTHPSLT